MIVGSWPTTILDPTGALVTGRPPITFKYSVACQAHPALVFLPRMWPIG